MPKLYFLVPSIADPEVDEHLDATLIPFEGSKTITTKLESKTIDLADRSFDFRASPHFRLGERDAIRTDTWWCIVSPALYAAAPAMHAYASFPVRLLGDDDRVLTDEYRAVRLPLVADLIDLDASQLDMHPVFAHRIMAVHELRLNEPANPLPDYFRLQEYSLITVISERAKAQLEAHELRGVEIIEVDAYEW